MAVTHYLEALDFQKEIVKIHTIFGGKNPHPNWLVGGVPCPINVNDGRGRRDQHGAPEPGRIIADARRSSSSRSTSPTCWPSAASTRTGCTAAGCRQEHAQLRRHPAPGQRHQRRQPAAARRDHQRRPSKIHRWTSRIRSRSRSSSPQLLVQVRRRDQGPAPLGRRHRAELRAGPNHKGTRTHRALDEAPSTRWIKAPRWRGHAMEVGPLSRMVLGYLQPKGQPVGVQGSASIDGVLKKLDVPVTALFSTLGRTAARAIEAATAAATSSSPRVRPAGGQHQGRRHRHGQRREVGAVHLAEGVQGRRFHRAPRGALGHWVKIQRRQDRELPVRGADHLERQPARCQGQIGAFEASLMNTPLAKADQPLEILRTIPPSTLPRVQHARDEPGRRGAGPGDGALNLNDERHAHEDPPPFVRLWPRSPGLRRRWRLRPRRPRPRGADSPMHVLEAEHVLLGCSRWLPATPSWPRACAAPSARTRSSAATPRTSSTERRRPAMSHSPPRPSTTPPAPTRARSRAAAAQRARSTCTRRRCAWHWDQRAGHRRAGGHRLTSSARRCRRCRARPRANYLMGYIRFAHFAAGYVFAVADRARVLGLRRQPPRARAVHAAGVQARAYWHEVAP